ncbi:NTP transferase domain-containing protein [Ochrobactrum teleogrylli]|uniref:NTP transferase domain-containing protein n=1 Tax=Ochrobactrum teleogrylli TaxID=2479765 RepID=UPI00384FDB4E
MIFGRFPLTEAVGAVLAHKMQLASGSLAKGRVLTADDIERLLTCGLDSVVAARLETGDILEDEAAGIISAAIITDHLRPSRVATGRANIHAVHDGLFIANKEIVDKLNRIDPAITIACLADHATVRAGALVATIKIIPLGVSRLKVEAAIALLRKSIAFTVKPFQSHAVTLIATELPTLKPAAMDKTTRILERRIRSHGGRLVGETRAPHEAAAVAGAIRNALSASPHKQRMLIVFGASAVVDRRDVIPEAIRLAGGYVEQIGMPVDPGNLLVLGWIGDVPVIGAPGCARSPSQNGLDWILSRLLAGERPGRFEITGMGVGGLLAENPGRPSPTEYTDEQSAKLSVGAILLCAGLARRMGKPHKLLAEFDGVALVRRVAQMLLSSEAAPVVAVIGHRREEIEASLAGLDLSFAFNPDFETGMASSLVAGISHAAISVCDGVLIMLADMPGITQQHINTLIQAFRKAAGRVIVRATFGGRRGNPVILPRELFEAVLKLEGDIGARAIVEMAGLPIVEVEIGPAALLDIDRPEDLFKAGGSITE